ncbi:hypothetical protein BZG02_14055 [Labilibaculum filiforme]|uniref:Uncharacterized protein n=1 Tax=Labilibaculum filiforme TaxID=1940526 RepID=A0A2N3HVG6_9BACT|nr:hypothetical protein [Labilibaculum filiforme]PKQ62054.1 hypothetical protein BZG02_14055 [Labilibaculum filiforme]
MIIISRLCVFVFLGITVFLFCTGYTNSSFQKKDINKDYLDTIKLGLDKVQSDPEESLKLLRGSYEYCMQKKDFENAVHCLIGITDVERFRGNYNIAFEKLWDALLLAGEKQIDHKNVVIIHRNIGILYGIFNKDSAAINHLSIALRKTKLLKGEKMRISETTASYFSLASIYRDNKEYSVALQYLDSCNLLNPEKALPYVETDKGYLYLKLGNLKLAEKHLINANKNLSITDERYLAVNYSFLGDLKIEQNKTDSALYFFTTSLKTINAKKAFVEFKPEILRKMSLLYLSKANYGKAYNYLNASAEVSDSLFNAKSENNSQLFEIKNKYKETLIEKDKLVQKQISLIKQKNTTQVLLKFLIGFILLIGISGFLLIRLRAKLHKLNLKQRMEKEKNSAILDVKSKELTTYALQMIDKEKVLHELLETIKEVAPGKYSVLSSKYLNRNSKLWNEFNMRFVEVNSDFYAKLREEYPNLTATEQKHCALIKLNFDSNEMAQILNISLQSVHTSRYRIRKKMNITREQSLSYFIAEL